MKLWLVANKSPNLDTITWQYLRNVAALFSKAGAKLTLFYPDAEPADVENQEGYREYAFKTGDAALSGDDDTPSNDSISSYPYNILDPITALSFQTAEELDKLAKQDGLPDAIEFIDIGGLAYYTLLRQLMNQDYFSNTPIVIQCLCPTQLYRTANHQPAYKLPYYLHTRLEAFCYHAAADVIVPSSSLQWELSKTYQTQERKLPIFPFPLQINYEEPVTETGDDSLLPQALCLEPLTVANGVIELVQQCHLLWKKGHRFALFLAGTDSEFDARSDSVRQYLKRKYACYVEDELLFLGNDEETLNLLNPGYVSIIPNRHPLPFVFETLSRPLQGPIIAFSHAYLASHLVESDNQQWVYYSQEDFEKTLLDAFALSKPNCQKYLQKLQKNIQQTCALETYAQRRIEHFSALKKAFTPATQFPFAYQKITRQTEVKYKKKPDIPRPQCVSIIIPFYNTGDYTKEIIESIEANTYPDIEVVVVDDGSDDKSSIEQLEYLQKRLGNLVRIIHVANQGLATARNLGAQEAEGEFLAFIDADDAFEANFIERAVQLLNKFSNVHIVYSWERCIGASDAILPNWTMDLPYALGHNMAPARAVVRRDAFLACGGNDPQMAYNLEDYECWIRMIANGCGAVSIPEPLVKYRVRGNSLWQTATRNQLLYLYERMTHKHPELYQQYGHEVFNLLNANGPGTIWEHPSSEAPYERNENWQNNARIAADKYAESQRQYAAILEQKNQQLHQKIDDLNRQIKKTKRKWSKWFHF